MHDDEIREDDDSSVEFEKCRKEIDATFSSITKPNAFLYISSNILFFFELTTFLLFFLKDNGTTADGSSKLVFIDSKSS